MALPYPNMDFTALDVLHAADLDKLVANIEYLANKFPVSSTDVDWTTASSSDVPISDFLTAETGFTINGMVSCLGNTVYGNLVIYSTSALTNVQTKAFTVKSPYAPVATYNSFCSASNSEWQSRQTAYFYVVGNSGVGYLADHENSGTNHWFKATFIWRKS